MAYDKILAEKRGPIGSLIFNNPEKRNAISLDMTLAAADVLADFAADDSIRVIVLSGAGTKAFISGGDISKFESQRANPEQVEEFNRKAALFRTRMSETTKPTIAMIRGYCLGGGLTVALMCDIRIAADDARFGVPAARLGVAYLPEALRQLVELVGPSAAKDIMYSARQFGAQEAFRLGLVNQVVSAAELESCVESYAQTIAGNAPLTIVAARTTIEDILKDPARRDPAACARAMAACFGSEDYAEGRRAFMEKRKPVFKGK